VGESTSVGCKKNCHLSCDTGRKTVPSRGTLVGMVVLLLILAIGATIFVVGMQKNDENAKFIGGTIAGVSVLALFFSVTIDLKEGYSNKAKQQVVRE